MKLSDIDLDEVYDNPKYGERLPELEPGEQDIAKIVAGMGFTQSELYDDSPEPEELYTMELNLGLSDWEIEDAVKLENLMRGHMIVTGEIGSGKGLFANLHGFKMKRYYSGKKALLDYRPRRLFGAYVPFTEEVLKNELRKMTDVSLGIDNESKSKAAQSFSAQAVKKAAKLWLAKDGLVLLQNSVIILDEYWRYFHNRQPFNPMGIVLGGIVKIWRHLDALIIGMAPRKHELDRFSCLPYVTHEVRCSWMKSKPDTTLVRIYFPKSVGANGVLTVRRRRVTMTINGREPREALGGKGAFSLFNSKSAVSISPNVYTGQRG
ncbi:hypothetical protein LCGC14_0744890 [marine sediment metagenome]|uniref:Uncharacterized protein n=1 Tax=marine sediment metagenome TaxID=412755 RepID=A0A0F9SQS1_9ZZZZ